MKKVIILLLASCLTAIAVMAQEEEEQQGGFKKQNLFTGGSITVSFFNGQTILGGNPIFGYKIANWLDAGIVVNYVYSSIRYDNGDKLNQSTLGPGVFTRIYPVRFLFLQAQLEHNFSNNNYFYASTGQKEKWKGDANSLLVGGGIAQGRENGSTTFYYICLLFDVLKNVNSPYVNVTRNPANPSEPFVDAVPIIRAGVNIGLFQGRYNTDKR